MYETPLPSYVEELSRELVPANHNVVADANGYSSDSTVPLASKHTNNTEGAQTGAMAHSDANGLTSGQSNGLKQSSPDDNPFKSFVHPAEGSVPSVQKSTSPQNKVSTKKTLLLKSRHAFPVIYSNLIPNMLLIRRTVRDDTATLTCT